MYIDDKTNIQQKKKERKNMEKNRTLSKKPSISYLGSVMNIILQSHVEDALLKLIHNSART